MNVTLGEKWEQFIKRKLRSGDYQSASELVRDGLRLLEQRDLLEQRGTASSFEELQDALLTGVRGGPATPMTNSDWKTLHDEVSAVAKKIHA